MRLYAVALVLANAALTSAAYGVMNQAQINEALFWHNKARREIAKQGICGNMLEMEWNVAIANAAQSNNCPTTHNKVAEVAYGSYIGENLAWASGSPCPNGGHCSEAGLCGGTGQPKCDSCTSGCSLKNRIYTGWYQSETLDPSSTTDNCETFRNGGGHCTQVVWQNSDGLGCSYQTGCSRWDTTLACSYGPPGNMNVGSGAVANIGKCIAGAACSACPSTHPVCDDGVCAKAGSSSPPAGSPPAASPPPATSGPITEADYRGTCEADYVMACGGQCVRPAATMKGSMGNGVCNDWVQYGIRLNCPRLGCDGGDCPGSMCAEESSSRLNSTEVNVDLSKIVTPNAGSQLAPQVVVATVVFSSLYVMRL